MTAVTITVTVAASGTSAMTGGTAVTTGGTAAMTGGTAVMDATASVANEARAPGRRRWRSSGGRRLGRWRSRRAR
jgi:hypothetical protein